MVLFLLGEMARAEINADYTESITEAIMIPLLYFLGGYAVMVTIIAVYLYLRINKFIKIYGKKIDKMYEARINK